MSTFKQETNNKEEIIDEFMPFITYTARKLSWRLPPHMTIDDLISVGLMALMRTVERFEGEKGSLKTYSEIRIKGSMVDELRASAWMPRSIMAKIKTINNARIKLEKKNGWMPDDCEVAKSAQMPLDEYFRILQHATSGNTVRLEEITSHKHSGVDEDIMQCIADPDAKSPLDILEKKNKFNYLVKLLRTIPEQQRKVLFLYYFEERTLTEIGGILNVTPTRVCQIRGKAVCELKTRMHPSFS